VPLDLFALAYAYSKISDTNKEKMWICGFQNRNILNEDLCGYMASEDDINVIFDESIPTPLHQIPNTVLLVQAEGMRPTNLWDNWKS
jgi:hypothetical protein